MILAEQARVKSAYFTDPQNYIEKVIWTAIIEWEMFCHIPKSWIDRDEYRSMWYEIWESEYSSELCKVSRE